MLTLFLYKSIIRFAQFVILRLRADVDKEVEILVLRHQLAVLRRQIGKVRTQPADRAILALLSRLLSRERWPTFFVTPAMLVAGETVTAAALRSGLGSDESLRRACLRRLGVTPSAYRARFGSTAG